LVGVAVKFGKHGYSTESSEVRKARSWCYRHHDRHYTNNTTTGVGVGSGDAHVVAATVFTLRGTLLD
jgi:hypothetical protein